jgi:hypothetical protein
MGMARGDVLKYAIAFALRRARRIVRGLKEGLTEAERYAVPDCVVRQLKERGDLCNLEEETKSAKPQSTQRVGGRGSCAVHPSFSRGDAENWRPR